MTQPRYPKAAYKGDGGPNQDGQGWGPLPDIGRGASVDQIRLVLHTTETKDVPAYRMRRSNGTLSAPGYTAPHHSYDAPRRRWIQHNEHHRRVGTLLGRSRTGVIGNEISVQIEIVCYSDKAIADRVGGLWVGDFGDGHYQDLADFCRWARANLFVPHLKLDRAYGPAKDFDTWLYGERSARRMSRTDWLNAGGILTAHGAAPGNSHWDTGVLDLHRILALSLEDEDEMQLPPIAERYRLIHPAMKEARAHPLIEDMQRLLNVAIRAGALNVAEEVPENGDPDEATMNAAKVFERDVMKHRRPDGALGRTSVIGLYEYVEQLAIDGATATQAADAALRKAKAGIDAAIADLG